MTSLPFVKDSHCSYCGSRFPAELSWPRRCPACGNVSYRNPLPVSVVLLPVGDGLLLVFGCAPAQSAADLPPFAPLAEVSETVIISISRELAFSMHTEVLARYFGERSDT